MTFHSFYLRERQHWVYNDGGRKAAGYKGSTGDCVCRSLAIAMEASYEEVYQLLALGTARERHTKHSGRLSGRRTAGKGIHTGRKWFKDFMVGQGWTWVPTMGIGTGCKVHLKREELPSGRLIVALSKHMCAVIDGVIHDTYDPSRDGTRCVYGYWHKR